MKTKREVLEAFKEYAMCEGIYCSECPCNNVDEIGCPLGKTLTKLGAETMLENSDLEEWEWT